MIYVTCNTQDSAQNRVIIERLAQANINVLEHMADQFISIEVPRGLIYVCDDYRKEIGVWQGDERYFNSYPEEYEVLSLEDFIAKMNELGVRTVALPDYLLIITKDALYAGCQRIEMPLVEKILQLHREVSVQAQ